MIRKWEISTDGGTVWSEVEPKNGGSITFSDARNLGDGQIFYRRTIGGGVLLMDADFDSLLIVEQDPDLRCATMLIRLMNRCGGQWLEFWRGEFSTGSATWDLDECSVEISPTTADKYTCILEKANVKANILNTDVVDVNIVSFPSGMQINFNMNNIQQEFGKWANTGQTQTLTFPSGMGICSGTTFNATIFWRETAVTNCLNGSPVAPPGSGWLALSDSFGGFSGPNLGCDDHGKVRWAREPLSPWPFPSGAIAVGPSGGAEPDSPTCANWYRIGFLTCVGGFSAGIFLCPDGANITESIDTARKLEQSIEYLTEQTGCDLEGIRSDFFEWNPPGDAPGYSPGINYVTGIANQVNELLILQKSDVINPSASNPATIGEMTFAEAMKALFVMFRVLWDIDEDGYLRIEHWTYWTQVAGLDITTTPNTIEPQRYEHLQSQVPRLERASFMEALSRDFVGLDIIYSGPCAGKETKEWSPGKITTDVSFVLSDPDAIAKEGFVILATNYNGVDYDTIVSIGEISTNLITNAPLSWANLQRDFWTWDRYLPTGNMNGSAIVFDGFVPNIEQADVSIALCCLEFDPGEYLTTKLGQRLGITQAVVESAEHNLLLDTTTLTLRYAY